MSKIYKSQKTRLVDSRAAFHKILSEKREKPIDTPRSAPITGFPGHCCDNGVCIPVSFASASDGCSVLGLVECLDNGGCPSEVIEPVLDDDTGGDILIDKPTITGCELELTLGGNCAQMAGMPNSFVGNMTNAPFFQNMSNGYNQFGCSFFNAVRTKHQNMINSGIVINSNHPAPGTQMGPLWIAQKQSKVQYLTCMLSGPCCVTGPAQPDDQIGNI